MVRFALFATALCLCVIAWPPISDAQPNPFKGSSTFLHGDDWALMNGAASQLYQQERVADGAASHWSNPKTGDSAPSRCCTALRKPGWRAGGCDTSFGCMASQDCGDTP